MPAKRAEKRDVTDHAQKVDDIVTGHRLPWLMKRKPEKIQSLRCFDIAFQTEAIRYFSMAFKVILSSSDRYKIFTND